MSETFLKILLIGDSGTGKSSIMKRYCDDFWVPEDQISATIGVDFKLKHLEIDGNPYKLTLWDTAGQERFRTLTSSYYRGAQGVIMVYDVSHRESFDNLNSWFQEIEKYCSSLPIVKIIIGNKTDISNRQVTRKEGEALAQKMGTLFIETSAKTKLGIQEAFDELLRKIIETPSLWESRQKRPSVNLNDQNSKSKNMACCN